MEGTLSVSRINFDGAALKRGFWLYVAEIVHSPGQAVAYVGRTGDTSSANAASLFTRITAHLSEKKNAKANSLLKRLVEQDLPYQECSYRFFGIGPLFEQQTSMELHKPIRDQMAGLERAVADHLRDKGYHVLGEHPKARHVDEQLLNRVLKVVDEEFSEPLNSQIQRTGVFLRAPSAKPRKNPWWWVMLGLICFSLVWSLIRDAC